jgi:uracil-DNA glycosylase family 4
MPLVKECSLEAYRKNIRIEIEAGRTPEQAVAIAANTVRAACKDAGKPVPRELEVKKGRACTREYLEAALEQAKRLLPGWMYAVLHRAALPASGGRAAMNRRLAALEKAWLHGLASMSDEDLKEVCKSLLVIHSDVVRKGQDTQVIASRLQTTANHMHQRGLEIPEELAEVEKGFLWGRPEGGMHVHGLDRRNAKTFLDGKHVHLFVVPGTGQHLLTVEDGEHVHSILKDGQNTDGDGEQSGRHAHAVYMPNGEVRDTRLGGAHGHCLMLETSGFDGRHVHELELPDGTVIKSLTVGGYLKQVDNLEAMGSLGKAPCASEVMGALNELRYAREEMARMQDQQEQEPMGEYLPVAEVIELCAKTGELPALPVLQVRVSEVDGDLVVCEGAGGTTHVLVKGPHLRVHPDDIVDVDIEGLLVGFSKEEKPSTAEEIEAALAYTDVVKQKTRSVAFSGEPDARLVFVGSSPSALEIARNEALIGQDGALFHERYLEPLGLSRKDVAVGFAVPVLSEDPTEKEIELWRDRLLKEIARFPKSKVVALGRVAKAALGTMAVCSLPHPAALRRHGDTGEVARKLKTLAKKLDKVNQIEDHGSIPACQPSKAQTRPADSTGNKGIRVSVVKEAPKKQIVYGVVLDPYQVDLQGDWIPPAEIEATAHEFLEKSRVIGLRHNGKADAQLVESWVEPYPTERDREAALSNTPHKVSRRQFGSDTIHSGAWVAGVRLSDRLWKQYESGELDAFSIGGFSLKTKVAPEAMPQVEFVDLKEVSSV